MMSITNEEWAIYAAMLSYGLIGSSLSVTVSLVFCVCFIACWSMLMIAIRLVFLQDSGGSE